MLTRIVMALRMISRGKIGPMLTSSKVNASDNSRDGDPFLGVLPAKVWADCPPYETSQL